MKVINNIKCYTLSKLGKCWKYYYTILQNKSDEMLELIPINQSICENVKIELNNILNVKDIVEKELPIYEKIENGEESINFKCELNPRECIYLCKKLENEVKNLVTKHNKIINSLRNFNDVFHHMKELSDERSRNYEDIHIKFRYDKHDNLVCLFFDRNEFDIKKSHIKGATIYLSFGEIQINERTRLYFHYNRYNGAIKIDDFFSTEKRKGHGSYVLEFLIEIIPYLNSKIEEYNKWFFNELKGMYTLDEYIESTVYNKKINYIFGEIVPDGSLTYEELKDFYATNGFIKDDRLYKEV